MKLQPDRSDAPVINAHGPGWVAVNGTRYTHALLIDSRGSVSDWACTDFETLAPEHFERLGLLRPELVIFGSGKRLRFPAPSLLSPLYARRIGLETMDTVAACRTYNILSSEGRHVLAALLIEADNAQA